MGVGADSQLCTPYPPNTIVPGTVYSDVSTGPADEHDFSVKMFLVTPVVPLQSCLGGKPVKLLAFFRQNGECSFLRLDRRLPKRDPRFLSG